MIHKNWADLIKPTQLDVRPGNEVIAVDAEARTVDLSEARTGYDLFDLAAVQTLSNGGTVYAVEPGEMPGGGEVAAVYRF